MTGVDVRKLFSMNMKRLRAKQGFSQLSLANEVGLAHNFINDIENGKKWVSPDTIAKLANALKAEPYQFFLPAYKISKDNAELISSYIDDISESFLKAVGELKNQYHLDDDENEPD
ncbi:helix-turn-helix domain-containing protein [Breznakiella homolactica]|uniref:Helix-turn-helix transcriptional regulator n=1 Tax=Breznakiella homolactica TaxID=2798577 RepID=A0A7T7XNX7_9SPIR|nr:helix-turn-helix transcriptional regulator [Breznakiella homolactica]QQO09718.1 helix-turn-helix domain-containing protein [Breznakiella homolactica]